MPKHLFIKLGAILPFIAAPRGDFRVMGMVQEGMQFGYLVVSPSGEYLQVNGAHSRTLNATKVNAALRRAEHFQHRPLPQASSRPPQPLQPSLPAVTVRKRRLLPTAAADDRSFPARGEAAST